MAKMKRLLIDVASAPPVAALYRRHARMAVLSAVFAETPSLSIRVYPNEDRHFRAARAGGLQDHLASAICFVDIGANYGYSRHAALSETRDRRRTRGANLRYLYATFISTDGVPGRDLSGGFATNRAGRLYGAAAGLLWFRWGGASRLFQRTIPSRPRYPPGSRFHVSA